MNLRRVFLSSVVWSSVADLGQRAFSFIIMLVLVRLLSLQDFGTSATAMMIVQLLQPVTRFGIYDYLIQRRELSEEIKGAAFMASLMFGCLATVVMFACADLIAMAFSDPNLAPVMRALSIIFLIRSVSAVYEALLVKQFGFKTLAVRTLGAVVVSGLMAVSLAFAGWGVYALVMQQLTASLMASIILVVSYRWVPSFKGARAHIRSILTLGSRYTASQLFSSINNNIYGLIIGLVVSTEAAGIFRLAWSGLDLCMQLTIRPFMQVAQPLFSKLQADRFALGQSYLKVTQHCAALTFPIFGMMAIMGPEIGAFLYGPRWVGVGYVLSIICLIVFPATPNYLIGVLLNAVGRPEKNLQLSAIQSVLSVIFAYTASRWGMMAVAIAFVIRPLFTTPMSFRLLNQSAEAPVPRIARALFVPITAALAMMLAVFLTKSMLVGHLRVELQFVATGLVGLLVYGALVFLMDRQMVMGMLSTIWPKAAKLRGAS